MSEITQNAERVRYYQERKQALSDLAAHNTEENLCYARKRSCEGQPYTPPLRGRVSRVLQLLYHPRNIPAKAAIKIDEGPARFYWF